MKTFIGITGTTSVGKSAVAVQLAKLMHTEIISADSMQVYRGMDIGTAKIATEQMQGVTHHMLDIVEPNENYSSFLYSEQASRIIDNMIGIPIVVGGTGFYFDSLVYPPEYGNATQARRQELIEIYRKEGLPRLQQLLREKDAAAADIVDMNNYKRIIRAIEIAENGESRAAGKGKTQPRYNQILFVLQRNRKDLFAQIENRVDNMLANGLVEEVKFLLNKYGLCNTPAFEAIGYKEIIEYLQGKCSLTQAIEQIKINTRHYAKKQITYYKRMNPIEYIDVDNKNSEEVALHIYKVVQNIDLI